MENADITKPSNLIWPKLRGIYYKSKSIEKAKKPKKGLDPNIISVEEVGNTIITKQGDKFNRYSAETKKSYKVPVNNEKVKAGLAYKWSKKYSKEVSKNISNKKQER